MSIAGRSPKIVVHQKSDVPTSDPFMVSGKKIGNTPSKMNKSKNEFTFNNLESQDVTRSKFVLDKDASGKTLLESKGNNKNKKKQDKLPSKLLKDDSITKEQIYQKLGIVNPEAEDELDLVNMSLTAEGKPKTKNEVTKDVVTNLEKEIEKLKYKRDTYLSFKTEKEVERVKKALEDDRNRDRDRNVITLHESPGRIQTFSHNISSLEKPTLENVEALLRAHKDKVAGIEFAYMEKRLEEQRKNLMMEEIDRKTTKVSLKDSKGFRSSKSSAGSKPKDSQLDEEPHIYGKIEPPPAMNTYMINEYIMDQKRHKKLKLDKPDYLKNYKEKFLEHMYYKEKLEKEKKEEVVSPTSPAEKKDFERYMCTSPNRERATSPNKWASDHIVENDKKAKVTKTTSTSQIQSPTKSSKAAGETISMFKRTGSAKMLNSSVDTPQKFKGSRARSAKKFDDIEEADHIQYEDEQFAYDEEVPTEEELKLLQWVFNMMPQDERGEVGKDEVLNCILQNGEICELYEINKGSLNYELAQFPSRHPSNLTFSEFVTFLKMPRKVKALPAKGVALKSGRKSDKKKSVAEILSPGKSNKGGESRVKFEMPATQGILQQNKKFENVCLLPKETLETFKEIFSALDRHEDLVVSRLEYLKQLRRDVRISRLLHKPAIHIQGLEKTLTLERVLTQIEEEETQSSGEAKRSKEFISLSQFMKYFLNYELPAGMQATATSQAKTSGKRKDVRVLEDDDSNLVELSQEACDFFAGVFDNMEKRTGNYVVTILLIDEIRAQDTYQLIKQQVGRRKAAKYVLPSETIEEVIDRIENEAENSIDWKEFMEFFTKRGRPSTMIIKGATVEKEMIDEAVTLDPRELGTQTEPKIVEYIPNRDGYDSDPEFHTRSKDINYQFKVRRGDKKFDVEDDEDEESFEIVTSPKKSQKQKYLHYHRDDPKPYYKSGTLKSDPETATTDKANLTDGEVKTKKKKEKEYKFTIPQPYDFDERDRVKKNKLKKSIRERKVEEMLEEKQQEELRIKNHVFRAKSVPHTTTTPLFEQITKANKDRRDMVKAESIAITKMNEKPFNFYIRDQGKPPKPEEAPLNSEFGKRFKAKPIPEICAITDVWARMKEEEEISRKERVARLAQQNLQLASLPPRMAKHEMGKKEKERREGINRVPGSGEGLQQTFKAKEIPQFEKLQRMFQDLLEKKRRGKRPTVPTPFAFGESKKGAKRDYLDIENQYKKAAKDDLTKKDPFEAVRRLKETKPKYQPPTTKKMVALMDKLKQEREEKEAKAEKLRQEDQEREDRYKKMKPRVQTSQAIVDNTKANEEQAMQIKVKIKEQFKQSAQNFKNMKQEIDNKVALRPLLVEQEGEKSKKQQLQAMKDIARIEKVFKDSGLKNTNMLFNADEREKLEDIKFLERQGYKTMQPEEDE
jgi:hypothetical protein